jgi:ABC-2 type transport system permease protein
VSRPGWQRHGTFGLVRAEIRLDRVRITVWIAAITAMVAVSARAVADLFPTQADLDRAAASSENPAIIAFQGPAQALDTLGGQVAFQIGAPGLVIVALMTLLMTGRMTRTEEEAGRLELVRSLPVGRNAPILSASIVGAGMSAILGALVTTTLIVLDLPVAGSVSFGLGYTAVGTVFTGVSLVTAQVTENHRLANGLAGCVLGASFVLRAIGDMNDGTLSWCSPIGWAQQARPFADERWWPLALALVVAAVLAGTAVWLQSIRDLGAGLVPPRPGPARAGRHLAGPMSLTARLQRGSVIGWASGTALLALVYGSVTSAIESFVADNPDLADFLVQSGGDLTDSYLATAARTTALVGSGFAIGAVLRLRSEETNDRAEPVLATPVSRIRYWAAHLLVAAAGTLVVFVAAGVVLGASAAVAVGDGGLVVAGTAAMLVYLPAVVVVMGVAALLVGLLPTASSAAWATLVAGFVMAMFGTLLDLPDWVMRVSPFQNVALVPAEHLAPASVLALTAIGLALLVAGAAGYRRRDIPT